MVCGSANVLAHQGFLIGWSRPKPVVQLAVSIRLLIRTSPANSIYHEMKAIMPGIVIELNGSHFITIDLAGMDVVDVSVHGALDQVSKAVLDAHGGNYSDGGCGHLIWVAEQSILSGEALNVKLIEACGITAKGRTIQELYPDDEPVSQTDFTISEEMAAEIRARPRLHKAFSVEAATSNGQLAAAMSNELNTSFTFGVLWDFTRPNQARVRLNTHCLDDVLARKAGTRHLEAVLSLGDSASFSLNS